mgnify:CR=1 FL=1
MTEEQQKPVAEEAKKAETAVAPEVTTPAKGGSALGGNFRILAALVKINLTGLLRLSNRLFKLITSISITTLFSF